MNKNYNGSKWKSKRISETIQNVPRKKNYKPTGQELKGSVLVWQKYKEVKVSRNLSGVEDGNNNPVYKTAKETLMYRTVLWTLWERERVGRFGRMALKHVKYHVWHELPVQVRCMILDAWG